VAYTATQLKSTGDSACRLRYSPAVRWCCVLLLFAAGCTSAWERHESLLAQDESRGDYAAAVGDVRWLIDNAFDQAPPKARTSAAEAARYLHLADAAVKAGKPQVAVEALREALTIDPHLAPKVRAQLDRLPLPAAERNRLQHEFAWNIAALAPADDLFAAADDDPARCWSYRVHEVRLRLNRTVKTADGPQRQVTYDSRAWLFDAPSAQWRVDGDWVSNAGSEAESIDGPPQPRYRALTADDHQFYTDEGVPPCHRAAWQGPYDPDGTVFVAARPPGMPSTPPR
jgi:hypothetical protein